MRKLLAAAALLSPASITTIAVAQIKPLNPDGSYAGAEITQQAPMTAPTGAPVELAVPDARSLASDREVGEARRYYRAQCNQYQSPGYCDCVTAGVAQALMPAEVRIAARTIGERINAQGDAYIASDSDSTIGAESSAARIEQVEAHYAAACAQFRR
jgi:hypothetical protein